MEGALGRPRIRARGECSSAKKPDAAEVSIAVEETVHVGGERQWLGVGDDYGYGHGYMRREKSERLETKG